MLAAHGSPVGPVVRGASRPAEVLGVAPSALYLLAGESVLAVTTSDAVRLPCAVALTPSSHEYSLRDVVPDDTVTVGDGHVRWTSGGRPIEVDSVREWLPASVRPVVPRADRLAELRSALAGIDLGLRAALPSPASLLGRGPGLTPSGDDVLAGYALGRRALGADVPVLTRLHRTTALSAALLRHAEAGECIPQVAALVAALGTDSLDEPLEALLRVGHTSGAALARGVLLAMESTALVAA